MDCDVSSCGLDLIPYGLFKILRRLLHVRNPFIQNMIDYDLTEDMSLGTIKCDGMHNQVKSIGIRGFLSSGSVLFGLKKVI